MFIVEMKLIGHCSGNIATSYAYQWSLKKMKRGSTPYSFLHLIQIKSFGDFSISLTESWFIILYLCKIWSGFVFKMFQFHLLNCLRVWLLIRGFLTVNSCIDEVHFLFRLDFFLVIIFLCYSQFHDYAELLIWKTISFCFFSEDLFGFLHEYMACLFQNLPCCFL